MEMDGIEGAHIHEVNQDPLEIIEYLTKNVRKVQDQVLASILHMNRNTEYLTRFLQQGKSHNNNEENDCIHIIEDKDCFKKMVPVVDYEDVEPYIRRVAYNNENNILSAQPITELITSSGTSSGERKLMPAIAEDLYRKHFLYTLRIPLLKQNSLGLEKGKALQFIFISEEEKTPSGIVARPVVTSYCKSELFAKVVSRGIFTSPIEAILCLDLYQSMYCQMLCGLILKDHVVQMGSLFASGFLKTIRFLEKNWTSLCHDISNGQLNPSITNEPLRAAVMKLLSDPNPILAESIRMECSKHSWQGILGRIWNRACYIETIVTGTMSQYIPILDYYSGGLPLVSSMYASSECFFGINLKPFTKPSEVTYTFLPNMGYFEFIPLERSNGHDEGNTGNEEIVDLAHVKVGKEYEVIVTTYAGLYRYKVGDVLRVTGFYNEAPQFQFVGRKNMVLGVDAEKTDEASLHQAIQNAAKLLESEHGQWNLIDYTSYPDVSGIPGHYVIFWEVNGVKQIPASLLEDCCLCIEESLDWVYRELRNRGTSIGPLEIRVVQKGTFDALMDYFVSNGLSINQYKTPRCITTSFTLSLLNDKVLQQSFSPKCPSWTPSRQEWIS